MGLSVSRFGLKMVCTGQSKRLQGPITAFRKRIWAVLLLILSSLFTVSLSSFYRAARNGRREFDYFLLSLQWPSTFCQRTHHCSPANGCCISKFFFIAILARSIDRFSLIPNFFTVMKSVEDSTAIDHVAHMRIELESDT